MYASSPTGLLCMQVSLANIMKLCDFKIRFNSNISGDFCRLQTV